MRALPRRHQGNRRDDVLLSRVRQAPELLAEILREFASDLAEAHRRLGDAVPEYCRLAHEAAELPEDADPRRPLRDLVDALLEAWRP
jgi:hypothetical protein